MKNSIIRYRKTVNRLIKNSFPILKNENVLVIKMTMNEKYYAGVFWPFPGIMIVFVNSKLGLDNELALERMFAHELCHLEKSREIGWLRYICSYFSYWFSANIREQNEKTTDRTTVEKGYARGLYELKIKKPFDSEIQGYYLSAKDVKKYAQSIKKW